MPGAGYLAGNPCTSATSRHSATKGRLAPGLNRGETGTRGPEFKSRRSDEKRPSYEGLFSVFVLGKYGGYVTVTCPSGASRRSTSNISVHGIGSVSKNEKLIWSGGSFADLPLS